MPQFYSERPGGCLSCAGDISGEGVAAVPALAVRFVLYSGYAHSL